MRRPSLNSLAFFDTAAEVGGFLKAAHVLNVTHGAVSRQVRQLEDQLGVKLFERRNRSVYLTEHGEFLFKATRRMFEDLDHTLKALEELDSCRPLVVSCEPTITMKWLIPSQAEFNRIHPNIPLHILAAGGPIDLVKQRVDIALRRNDFFWPNSINSIEVAKEMIGPVCSPEMASQFINGASVPLLQNTRRPSSWSDWSRISKHAIHSAANHVYEYFHLSIQAAISGLGVAIASKYMVKDEIATGRLVAPFGFVPDGSSYFVLSVGDLSPDSAPGKFASWVKSEMVDAT